MGDTNAITNSIEGRFIRKSQARKLDNRREDYMKLVQKAEELNAKNKTEKATTIFAKADDVAREYNSMAESLGLYADLAKTMPAKSDVNLVADGVRLSKEQKKEIEKLEEGIEKTQKTLNKFSSVQLHQIEKGLPTELSPKDEAKAEEALRKNKQLKEVYQAKCAEYGIPSPNDILAKLYSMADPEKASKLRDEIKDELKEANMYFGFTKDYLKDDAFKNVSEAIAIENKVNDTLNKGYAGASKSVVRAMDGVSLQEAADVYDAAFGADFVANRRGNERTKANEALNRATFAEQFIADNQEKTFGQLDTMTLAGQNFKTSEITRITLLSGEVLTKNEISDIQLKDVRTIEVGQQQYSTKPVYYEKGKDSAYITRGQSKAAAKAMGYEFEGINVLKPIVDATGMGVATGVTALLSKYTAIFRENFYIKMESEGGLGIGSTMFENMFKEIKEKLEANGGKAVDLTDVLGFEYIKHEEMIKEHWCVAPAIAAAATTFVASLVDQYMKKEEIVPEKAYNAARERLTLEMKHNASGGDGYILNQKELDKALADLDVVLSKLITTPTPQKADETQPTAPTPAAKEATIQTADVEPIVEKAEYCVYQNKAGEYWDGIVRTAYVDANGKPISNEADIAALRKYIKQDVNGYKPSDAGMPKGVKLPTTYTVNGRTYTYGCAEPTNRIVSNALPEGKTAKDVAFGNPRVDLAAGTQEKTTPGSYSYNWSSTADSTFFGGNTFTSKADRDAAVKGEKEALEKGGFKVTVK